VSCSVDQGFLGGSAAVVSPVSAVPLRFFFLSDRSFRLSVAGMSVSRITAPELFCPLISVSSDGTWAGRAGDWGELKSGFVSGPVAGTGLVCGTGCGTDGSGVTGFWANAPAIPRSIVNMHARYLMILSGLVKNYLPIQWR